MNTLASALTTSALVLMTACDDGGGSTVPDAPAAIDAAPNPCAACVAGETCVQRFGGACSVTVACVATSLICAPNTCSAACEEALCNAPYQCQTRPPCGTEFSGAFTCYGP